MMAALAIVGALVVLSIAGAFLNVDRARGMFNSIPMVVFWFALLALLILGLVGFKRLIRSPGLLGAHLGSVLILVGAMFGSDKGHTAAEKLLHLGRVPTGFMKIYEGHMTSTVHRADGKQIGELPFGIGLKDFRIEHYEDRGDWMLGIDAPPAGGEHSHERRREVIHWHLNEEVAVPFIDARLKVLQYLPSARPVVQEGAGASLEVTEADGKKTVISPEVGRKVAVSNPPGSLRVVQAFTHLLVRGAGAVNKAGSYANPALKLEFEQPDGKKSFRFAFTGAFAMHGRSKDGLSLRYVMSMTAKADPDDGLPAMEVVLTHKDKELRSWLFGQDPEQPTVLSLAPLLGSDAHVDSQGHEQLGAHLMMAARHGPIRDYISDLVVIKHGRQERQEEIEVNHPMHYGGYHFYQHSYDDQHGRFTVLRVKSDFGLWPVWAGFMLLCAGTFWICWVQPAWRHFRRTAA